MQQIALSRMNDKVRLATIEVATHHGDVYRLPAMDVAALESLLPKDGVLPDGTTSLSLVNASMAILLIPFRIVKTVSVDGEVWWTCCRA